jgi:hypothetical protein
MNDDEIEPSWDAGSVAQLKKARLMDLTHEIISTDRDTSHEDPAQLTVQTSSLYTTYPTPIENLTTKHLRILLAPKPVIPRAWDPTDPNDHFGKLYATNTQSEYMAAMRTAFEDVKHHTIPAHMQDVLYKILTSGLNLGHNKTFVKARNPAHQTPIETLEETFLQGHLASELWKTVIKRWNIATHQNIEYTDIKATLLGDRGVESQAATRGLWRLLRTAVIWTLHKSKKAVAEGSDAQKRATSSSALLQDTQKTLQGLMIGAWVQRQPSDTQLWEYWNEAGWIIKRPQGRVVTILDCPPSRKASHTNLNGQSITRITYCTQTGPGLSPQMKTRS